MALAIAASVQAGQRQTPQEVAKQVDASLAAELFSSQTEVAPACDDATFLRRAWLDVVGDIPAPEHVIAFSLDPSPDKRERLVRELLADRRRRQLGPLLARRHLLPPDRRPGL